MKLEAVPLREGWPELSGWTASRSIGLHPERMKSIGIRLGFPAFIQPIASSQPPFLVSVWPINSISQSSLAFHPSSETASHVSKGQSLLCLPITSHIIPIVSLRLRPLVYNPLLSKPAFHAFLQTYLMDAYVALSQPLRLRYFAHSVELAVEDAVTDLSQSLSKLDISGFQSPDGRDEVFTPPVATSTPQRISTTSPSPISPSLLVSLPSVGSVTSSTSISIITHESKTTKPASTATFFEGIGGLKALKEELQLHILSGSSSVDRILLHGFTGTGKTMLVKSLAQIIPAFFVGSDDEVDERSDAHLIVLDPISDLLVKSNKHSESSRKLRKLLDWAECEGKQVIATTESLDNLPVEIRRRFQLELEVNVPSAEERREILGLELKLRGLEGQLSLADSRRLADSAHSFTAPDIKSIIALASSSQIQPLTQALASAMKRIQPSAMKTLTVSVPSVRWEEVAGEAELKLQLQQCVEWPLKHPELFLSMGMEPPKGILLYGPPGCAKTMVARAVATESGLNFVSVKGPELLSKWVGESERGVRELFRKARAAAPSIVFFDEIDAVGAARGGDSAVGDRVVAQLLTEMDGLEGWNGVRVMAATNRPDVLDPALLRPGRLDRTIFVPLPNKETRRGILSLHLAKMSASADLELDKLAEETEGYSGAEVVAVAKEAGMAAITDHMSNGAELVVTAEHLRLAVLSVTPRTSPAALKALKAFQLNKNNS